MLELLLEFWDLYLGSVTVAGLEGWGLPAEFAFEVLDAQVHAGGFLLLDEFGREGVLAIKFLKHVVAAVSYSTIIPDNNIFQGFDKFSLDVTCSGSLDGRVWQTFSTTHWVEKELVWL